MLQLIIEVKHIRLHKATSNDLHSQEPQLTFGSTFTLEQIHLIKIFTAENRLFDQQNLTDHELQEWLNCTPNATPLRVNYLAGIVLLMDALQRHDLICYNWQYIIEHNLLLLSKSDGTPIARHTLSSSLNQTRKSQSARVKKATIDFQNLCLKLIISNQINHQQPNL